jgi:hypothetical protein
MVPGFERTGARNHSSILSKWGTTTSQVRGTLEVAVPAKVEIMNLVEAIEVHEWSIDREFVGKRVPLLVRGGANLQKCSTEWGSNTALFMGQGEYN